MNNTLFLAALLLGIVSCTQQTETSTPTSTAKSSSDTASTAISEELAIDLVFDLPETKAWSDFIARKTEGKVHASLSVSPNEPTTVNGKQYWSINFHEKHPTHFVHWETFLVSLDGKEIMIEDNTEGEIIPIQTWRTKTKPLERVLEENAS